LRRALTEYPADRGRRNAVPFDDLTQPLPLFAVALDCGIVQYQPDAADVLAFQPCTPHGTPFTTWIAHKRSSLFTNLASVSGNHAFRRFRNTHLRNRAGCPEGLAKFWMGHADESMCDLYEKIKEDLEFRRGRAEKCGFGFKLPSVIPRVPKIDENPPIQKLHK